MCQYQGYDDALIPRGADSTNNTATTQTTNTQNVNLLVSEYCKEHECKPYTPPDIAILFNKILWANWATSVRFSKCAF